MNLQIQKKFPVPTYIYDPTYIYENSILTLDDFVKIITGAQKSLSYYLQGS